MNIKYTVTFNWSFYNALAIYIRMFTYQSCVKSLCDWLQKTKLDDWLNNFIINFESLFEISIDVRHFSFGRSLLSLFYLL